MKLRNRKSYLTALPEGNAPTTIGARLTRWTYYLILLGIVGYIGYVGYMRFTLIKGKGQVEVEKTILSAAHGGPLLSMSVKEGDHVDKGQMIARIRAARACHVSEDPRIEKARHAVSLKDAELKVQKKRLRQLTGEETTFEIRRALELEKDYIRREEQHKQKLRQLSQEVDILSLERDLLQARLETLESIGPEPITDPTCFDEYIVSPYAATVQRVLRRTHEHTDRGEHLVVLVPDSASVMLAAYLSKHDLSRRSIAQELQIEFPDGNTSVGVVSSIRSTAYVFPEREWESYESINSRIVAHLDPVDEEARALWLMNDRMTVKIAGKRE